MSHYIKMLNPQTFDFVNSTIIKPPTHDQKNAIKFTRLVIDSRDRNNDQHPTPSDYVIELLESIPDVMSAKLVHLDVPFSNYIINKTNNRIDIEIDGIRYTGHVEEGDWTEDKLGMKVCECLLATTGIEFYYEYNVYKKKLTFWSNIVFTFVFKADQVYVYDDSSKMVPYMRDTIGQILGFGIKMYSSTSALHQPTTDTISPTVWAYSLTSEFRVNMNLTNYIILSIDQFSVNTGIATNINRSFALISKTTQDDNMNISEPIQKFFNPPIAKLTRIRLRFTDYYGNLYDFQNVEHRIEMQLESLKNCRKYQG